MLILCGGMVATEEVNDGMNIYAGQVVGMIEGLGVFEAPLLY